MEIVIPTTITTVFTSLAGYIIYKIHKSRNKKRGYEELVLTTIETEQKSTKQYKCKDGVIILSPSIETYTYKNNDEENINIEDKK